MASVCLPAGNPGGEVLIGIGKASVVFFFKLIGRARGRIAAFPELFDELVAFFVRGQAKEGRPLGLINDVGDVFIQPLGVYGV